MEIPEHLLKRARDARDKVRLETDPTYKPVSHTRNGLAESSLTPPAAPTLEQSIGEIQSRFGVSVVPVPEGMPVEDATGVLEAFAPLGDINPEFIGRIAEFVRSIRQA